MDNTVIIENEKDGEIFAHIIKVPRTILFIPACVPLIPGGNLYYLALAMISSDRDKCIENLVLLSLYAVGIALGLAVVGEVEKMIYNLKRDRGNDGVKEQVF